MFDERVFDEKSCTDLTNNSAVHTLFSCANMLTRVEITASVNLVRLAAALLSVKEICLMSC